MNTNSCLLPDNPFLFANEPVGLHFAKMYLARARWFDKLYTGAPLNSLSSRKYQARLALEAYNSAFQAIQALMANAPLSARKMNAYLARLLPFAREACLAYYFWQSACLQGMSHSEVLDLADAALEAYRRGVYFVLAEYEKAFGERLE